VIDGIGEANERARLSEIQLVAPEKKDASCETASYFLDKTLVGILRPGDVFHIDAPGASFEPEKPVVPPAPLPKADCTPQDSIQRLRKLLRNNDNNLLLEARRF